MVFYALTGHLTPCIKTEYASKKKPISDYLSTNGKLTLHVTTSYYLQNIHTD